MSEREEISTMMKQLEAKYTLYDSVEDMLSPDALSNCLGRTVVDVTQDVFTRTGASDSKFELVKADNQLFVLKRMSILTDWMSLGSNDALCRSVRLWQYGVLDKLYPSIDHGIVAACVDGDGYALLMRDVSDNLIDYGHSFTISDAKILVDTLVTTHATFWNEDALRQPELGLSDTKTAIEAFWPKEYRNTVHSVLAPWLGGEDWWGFLFDYVESDVRDTMQSLMGNPQPLYAKLADFPSTLMHGDVKTGNFAILPEATPTVVFDWQLAGYTSPLIELHWSLTSFVTQTPFDSLDYYRQQLTERLGEQLNQEIWQQMVDVGYLAGVLRFGWIHAGMNHRNMTTTPQVKYLPEFNDIVRNGTKWL